MTKNKRIAMVAGCILGAILLITLASVIATTFINLETKPLVLEDTYRSLNSASWGRFVATMWMYNLIFIFGFGIVSMMTGRKNHRKIKLIVLFVGMAFIATYCAFAAINNSHSFLFEGEKDDVKELVVSEWSGGEEAGARYSECVFDSVVDEFGSFSEMIVLTTDTDINNVRYDNMSDEDRAIIRASAVGVAQGCEL